MATFDKKHCNIHHNGKLILHGERDKATTLWKIPLFTSEGETQYIPTSEGDNIVCNLEKIATKKDILHFLYASLFIPVKLTRLKAIKNEQSVTWPGINTTDVVGNQPILCYINCPMFGFQSLLSTICYRIHKGII